MRCQHSRVGPGSSEKPETALEAGGARQNTLAVGTVTVVMDSYWTRPAPLKVSSLAAKILKVLIFNTPAKLYVYDTLLGWLQ